MAVQTVFFPPPRSVDPDYWLPDRGNGGSGKRGKLGRPTKKSLQSRESDNSINGRDFSNQGVSEDFNQKEDRFDSIETKGNDMAMNFFKRSEIPSLRRVGTVSASIGDNGQIRFSTAASKVFEGCTLAGVGWLDEKKRVLAIQGFVKVPKNMSAEDLFKVTIGEKAKTAFITLSGLLRTIGYDYKASGNQTFDVTLDENAHLASLTIPKGALEAKPKVARPKKDKAATTVPAKGKSEPEEEEEEELEEVPE